MITEYIGKYLTFIIKMTQKTASFLLKNDFGHAVALETTSYILF